MLLHTKEIFWKFAFWYLFPLERGLTTGRWPRNSTSQRPPVHRSPSAFFGSAFLSQTIGLPSRDGKSEQMLARNSVTSSARWGLRHTQFIVTRFKLLFRSMWLRMTLTSHSTKEKWSLNWICCFEFWVPFHYNRVQKNTCVSFIVFSSAHCVSMSIPSQTDLQTCDAGHSQQFMIMTVLKEKRW